MKTLNTREKKNGNKYNHRSIDDDESDFFLFIDQSTTISITGQRR